MGESVGTYAVPAVSTLRGTTSRPYAYARPARVLLGMSPSPLLLVRALRTGPGSVNQAIPSHPSPAQDPALHSDGLADIACVRAGTPCTSGRAPLASG